MVSNEEEKRCPLCAEEMDWTDQQFMPCKCGYQICVWCWHHVIDMAEKDVTEGRCPACRSIYEKEKIVAMQAKCERTMMKISNRKMKPPKAKPKGNNDVRKDLTNVRVIQRKMAYVIGLPLSLADEDILIRKEYFGQYGKVTKVSLSRTAGGAVQQFVNDTCSAYITYSKEDEALRCIQSVHGFVLEGKYLRASFGTAKYCHAWLKNMPCNNPSCLYLHSVGPDEDSFGKDEVAAVHTRSRVQQIVGGTSNVAKRSGSVLPRADDMFTGGFTSTERSLVRSGVSDAIHGSANGTADTTHSLHSKEKEGATAVPHKMTSFVDIVGRSNSDSTDKDNNSPEDGRYIDQCLELSSVRISGDVHTRQPYSIPAMFEMSSYNCSGKGFSEDNPDESLRKYSLLSCSKGAKDTYVSSHRASFLHPSYSANNSDGQALSAKKAQSVNDLTLDWNSVHSRKDRVSLPTSSVNSTLNDFSQEVKFQNSTKSDKIYRSSRSFSNEEIVEHLRRISDDKLTNDEENSALDAVESSIISNIMSIDFDSSEDSFTMPNCLSEFLDESYCFGSSSWSSLNSDQSGYSFSKQEGCSGQTAGLVLPDYADNKEHYMCRPQYIANRTPCLVPPGFSMPSRDPPPGYSSSDRVGSRTSAGTLMPNASLPSALLQPSSTRLGTGIDDVDLFDPAILGFGKGKQTSGFSNLCFAARPSGSPGMSAFDDESRLWLTMQQSHPDSKFPQMFTSPASPLQQETCTSHLRNRLSTLDGIYSLSSQLADQHQNCSQPFFSETSQQTYANANGHFPDASRYQHSMDEIKQHRGEAVMADLGRNERLGIDRYFPGSYGDVMLSSGDVYARRVFGL